MLLWSSVDVCGVFMVVLLLVVMFTGCYFSCCLVVTIGLFDL